MKKKEIQTCYLRYIVYYIFTQYVRVRTSYCTPTVKDCQQNREKMYNKRRERFCSAQKM